MAAPFSAAGRARTLDRLDDHVYDLLVIGGGITGAGIALDAAARGLSVALVERDDLAAGTSSRSSNLIHGGLRYLAQAMFSLTRESAVERDRLRRLAPHLVTPLAFVVPDGRRRLDPVLAGVGLWLYDGLASFRNVSRHRRLSAAQLAQRVPGLAPDLAGGGFEYHDCRTDDARLVLQIARTAHRFGADVATRAEVTELRHADGRVTGATVHDHLDGRDLAVSARAVISATGVWADETRELAGYGDEPMLTPSKGIHLVFPAAPLPVEAAALVPSNAGDGRRVFVVPWGGQVIVGTTDDVYEGPLDAPSVELADAAYCCRAVNAAFDTALTPADAVGAWAGLRPLLASEAGFDMDSETLSRRHALVPEADGLLTVTGGKLTTYRRMAVEAVDRVAEDLGHTRPPSQTARIPLGLRGGRVAAIGRTRGVCEAFGVDPAVAEHLVARHGDEAADVVAVAASTEGGTEPLVEGLPYLRGEVDWAVDHEMALTVSDVLARRTRVALRDAAGGGRAAEQVAAVLAARLGWSADEAAASVAAYRQQLAAERGPVPLAASPVAA